jgi:hypothetical protein
MGEVGMGDGVTRLIEHLLERQVDELEMGLKKRKVRGLQSSQKPVGMMSCGHRQFFESGHGSLPSQGGSTVGSLGRLRPDTSAGDKYKRMSSFIVQMYL